MKITTSILKKNFESMIADFLDRYIGYRIVDFLPSDFNVILVRRLKIGWFRLIFFKMKFPFILLPDGTTSVVLRLDVVKLPDCPTEDRVLWLLTIYPNRNADDSYFTLLDRVGYLVDYLTERGFENFDSVVGGLIEFIKYVIKSGEPR